MLQGMTQKEMDLALIRAAPQLTDPEEARKAFSPYSEMELEVIKHNLIGGYLDNGNHAINDKYVNATFARALHGTPDAAKQNFFGHPIDEQTGQQFTPHDFEGWRNDLVADKINEILERNDGILFGGGVKKDILTASVTGSTGGGVLINQQVVPQLALWYYRDFKALSRINRVPAVGLDYEWNNELSIGGDDNLFLDDNGCPVITNSTYFRGRTNIGLVGVQRGTNLRLELAVRAGGVLYNGGLGPYELAMKGAVVQRARLLEKDWFQGTTLTNAGVSYDGTTEFGKTFTNGVNGNRVLLSGNANAAHDQFYPNPFVPLIYEQDMSAPGTIYQAIRKAVIGILNRGGNPTAIYCSFEAADRITGEMTPFIRYVPSGAGGSFPDGAAAAGSAYNGGMTAGFNVGYLALPGVGELPLIACPDDSVGKYTVASIGRPTINGTQMPATNLTSVWCQDIYIMSEDDLAFPYYGSPDPMPFEIPYGFGTFDNVLGQQVGCFNRRFIIYLFWGYAILVPIHQAKVRIPVSAPGS